MAFKTSGKEYTLLPDVLQSGVLAPFELLLRAMSTTLIAPIALGVVAYLCMCRPAKHH